MTASLSSVSRALAQQFSGPRAQQAAAIIAAFNAAKGNKDAQQLAIYDGLLGVACHADGEARHVQMVASDIRRQVTAAMRQAAGLPAEKAKGEKGSPDFSTPSVYAKVICDALSLADGPHAGIYDRALRAEESKREGGIPVVKTAKGIWLCGTLTHQRAVNSAATVMRVAQDAREAADLLGHDELPMSPEARIAQLESQAAALRAEVSALRAAGDPGASLTIARNERDAARAEALRVSEALRAAEALRAEALRDIEALRAAVKGKPAEALRAAKAEAEAEAEARSKAEAEAGALRADYAALQAALAEAREMIARQAEALRASAE